MKYIFILLLLTLFTGCSSGWNYFGNHNKMHYKVNGQRPIPYPIPIVYQFPIKDVTFFQPINWLGTNKGSSNFNYSHECNCVPYAYPGGMGFGAYVINDSFLLDREIINGYDGRKWNKEYFFLIMLVKKTEYRIISTLLIQPKRLISVFIRQKNLVCFTPQKTEILKISITALQNHLFYS